MEDRSPPPRDPITHTESARAEAEYDRTHCPVCKWEVTLSATKCPFCGAVFHEVWQRSSRSRVAVNTLLAMLKLGYVPMIIWALALEIFDQWERVLPLYSKDPRLGLSHWIWQPESARIYLAHPALEVMLLTAFALLWIIFFWPTDANRAGSIVNGFCTWVLFFPVPLTILVLTHPALAGPVGELLRATLRYGL